MREWALETGATNDGDDRANFLHHLPTFWLMIWHLFDEYDLLRFTCAQLREEHSASSSTTPQPVSRGSSNTSSSSRTRKLEKIAEDTLQLQKTLVKSVDEMGKAIKTLADAEVTACEFMRSQKLRRLDSLRHERYNTQRESLSSGLNEQEREVAVLHVQHLNMEIARIESELGGAATH
jgi:hypothetical protein